jgi:phosphoglucomutase
MTPIIFGTSGHRGIIGESFTHDHVHAIAIALAEHLKTQSNYPHIIMGHDPRTGNDPLLGQNSFTLTLVAELQAQGVAVSMSHTYCPTPVISWAIKDYKLDGGLILTASHNPPDYNGIKFNTNTGAPAPESVTSYIQERGNIHLQKLPKKSKIVTEPTRLHCEEGFSQHIKTLLQSLCSAQLTGLPIAIDVKHGACAYTWEVLAKTLGFKALISHAEPRADFGSIEPNPTKYDTLSEIKNTVKTQHCPIGIANDPDGDRHVILDDTGAYLIPEETTAIIADYLIQKGLPVDSIASTVASSQLIKSVCEKNNIVCHETKVGFKYFAEFFEKSREKGHLCLAVESSGGFSLSSHTYEKCGFLPGLLLLAISRELNIPISKLKENILKKYGNNTFLETSFTFEAEDKDSLLLFFNNPKASLIASFMPSQEKLNTLDGLKINCTHNSWALCRLSGTEPIARIYTESTDPETAQLLQTQARALLESLV